MGREVSRAKELPQIAEARRALAALHDLKPIGAIRDKAVALEEYAKVTRDPELLERAVRIKLEAWRNVGRVLREMRKAGELAKPGRRNCPNPWTVSPKTLKDHGISRNKSAAAEKLVALSERKFEERADLIVGRALRLIGAILKFEAERAVVELDDGIANVLYADPPWSYSNSGLLGSAASHYPTLTTQEICDYSFGDRKVKDIVADDAALFLWVTNPLVPDALRVIEAWGFSYKTNFVWIKDEALYGKLGFYNLSRHELLMVATRGTFVPQVDPLPESVLIAPKGKHSAKPDCYGLIESLYPQATCRELFFRGEWHEREGWLMPHGNEVADAA